MSTKFREKEKSLHVEELIEGIEKLTPSLKIIEDEIDRLNIQELAPHEKHQIIRNMERVWYLIKLLKLLQSFFKEKMGFGGDSVLNHLFLSRKYNEVPRFTFDLDASWRERVEMKRTLLKEFLEFNKHLAVERESLELPVTDDKTICLYTVEYDSEKDFFPDFLSLRYPILSRWSGEEFYKYARRITGLNMDYAIIDALRRIFAGSLGVSNARIDYIRFEVSIGYEYPVRRETIELPFNLGKVKVNVTELEYQLASKIANRVGKDFGKHVPHVLPDILKAATDLRLLKYTDLEKVKTYAEEISGESFQELVIVADKNLSILLKKVEGTGLVTSIY